MMIITVLTFTLLLYPCASETNSSRSNDEPILYYYGLEESERGLPACAPRQACSVYGERYWRRPAVLRLCRCARRAHCDLYSLPLNNRAQFKFCQPTTDWKICDYNETALVINATYEKIDPDELEILHHKDIDLTPPRVQFRCKCREPNYWQFSHRNQTHFMYKCQLLPSCESGEFCGHVTYESSSLYQSCTCPKHHICVHNGGLTHVTISELLYTGKGRRSYCQTTNQDVTYDDYY